MRGIFIRICQFVALLIMFGLGAWLLERAYTGMMRHHRPNRTSHPSGQERTEHDDPGQRTRSDKWATLKTSPNAGAPA